jgi:hypothetical protein
MVDLLPPPGHTRTRRRPVGHRHGDLDIVFGTGGDTELRMPEGEITTSGSKATGAAGSVLG